MTNKNLDVYLKITNQETKDVFDIVYEHIKVCERNLDDFVWWGNNQRFDPEKLIDEILNGKQPKALMAIPKSSYGNDNFKYVADIIDAKFSYEKQNAPDTDYVPNYYRHEQSKTWLKLKNFHRVESTEYDISNYKLDSSNRPLSEVFKTSYSCGYVYKFDDSNRISQSEYKAEGHYKSITHERIERNEKVKKDAKIEFKENHGHLYCEACGFDFEEKYGNRGLNYIEAHHDEPLYLQNGKQRIPKTSDFKMLCSNCHQMIHAKKDDFNFSDLLKILK